MAGRVPGLLVAGGAGVMMSEQIDIQFAGTNKLPSGAWCFHHAMIAKVHSDRAYHWETWVLRRRFRRAADAAAYGQRFEARARRLYRAAFGGG